MQFPQLRHITNVTKASRRNQTALTTSAGLYFAEFEVTDEVYFK